MTIRPPRPVRPTRNVEPIRELAIVFAVSLALTMFGLRAALSILEIHPWTIAWRVVEMPTMLLVKPLERWELMQRSTIGRLSLAELFALIVVVIASMITLSSLANRRR